MTADIESPGARYRAGVIAHRWEDDAAQQPALAVLDRLHRELLASSSDSRWMQRLSTLFGNAEPKSPQGLYLWGSVGRGKTFLMDLFAAGLPQGLVWRRHFHHFMAQTHAALRAQEGQRDPLQQVAETFAQRARVLCLDEFLVTDIGDAMILGGLLQALFARGVVLVTTSNTAPDDLYRGGLQRARFMPAIESIKHHCEVCELASPHDWRLRALRDAPIYQTPPGAEAERALSKIFHDYAHGDIVQGGELSVQGRAIAVRCHADNIAWFDFSALCDGPRAVADYIELAQRFPAVIVANVPPFNPDNSDPAMRFIHLVDEFYDRRTKLVLSAAAPIIDLYEGTRLRAPFARTQSRLIEMQSEEYLALAHRQD
ncbi:MAG: AFG1 family ATPase [Xanthomonadales bacterium]|nr:AFG1 family ATPase [Xanthomonadales bacterium]